VRRDLHHMMHPRVPRTVWSATRMKQAHEVLAFVREAGVVKPAQVDAHFDHGRVRNWFGGNSKASTQLLEGMHYRGMLRVVRREGGQRLYAVREHVPCGLEPDRAMDQLVDVIVAKYAPLPAATLNQLIGFLAGGVPQWREHRQRMLQCACWPRLTRWSGTAAVLNNSGAGLTVLKPTHPLPNGCADTTPCLCCGAIRSSAGPMWPSNPVC
jgi:uncharacterized protein YcaQ